MGRVLFPLAPSLSVLLPVPACCIQALKQLRPNDDDEEGGQVEFDMQEQLGRVLVGVLFACLSSPIISLVSSLRHSSSRCMNASRVCCGTCIPLPRPAPCVACSASPGPQDMRSTVRMRAHRKRPLGTIYLRLGEELEIAVQLFSMLQSAQKSKVGSGGAGRGERGRPTMAAPQVAGGASSQPQPSTCR